MEIQLQNFTAAEQAMLRLRALYEGAGSVSYTHLDVYKRQRQFCA